MQQSYLPLRPPQTNSLITPSASPPAPSRHVSVQLQSNKPAMNPPPFKRQRVSSTPRRTLHEPSPASSSSRSQPPIDIEKEREASRLRLLSAWENLTRLVRPLDEDDIVNLRTGKITRDNGVLRNTPRINFGNMINPTDNEGVDEDSDSGEDGEDEADELDTLSERPLDLDETAPIDFEAGPKVLPPVTPLDPQDNEDLQEFLRAEQQRKQLCGSDPETEEEEEEDEESEREGGEATATDDAQERDEGVDAEDEDPDEDVRESLPRQKEYLASSSPDASDAGVGFSDDELDNWNLDDASFVQPLTQDEEEGEEEEAAAAANVPASDSDIEIIDGPYIQSSPVRPSATNLGNDPIPLKSKSESPRKKATISQYLTPPLSSSSLNRSASLAEVEPQWPLDNDDVVSHDDPPPSRETSSSIPSVDLAKLYKARKSPTKPKDNTVSKSTSNPSSSSLKKTHIPKLKPIVLLTPRKPTPSEGKLYAEEAEHVSRSHSKGKQRATSSSPSRESRKAKESSQLQETDTRPSKSAKHSSRKKIEDKRPSVAEPAAGPSRIQRDISLPSPSHKTRSGEHYDGAASTSSPKKRKRRSSSGEPHLPRPSKHDHSPTRSPSESEESPVPSSHKSRSSRRRDRVYSSGSDSENAPIRAQSQRRSMSRPRTPSHIHPSASYFPDTYPPHNGIPPFGPIPDPRAQFIISQAMQQLSALVTGSWAPPPQPYDSATHPQYYPDPRYPNPYTTPTHRHPPRYDPTFSNATLPPSSPEPSPEKSASGRRKSLVGRSRSRGRRVSFHFDGKILSTDKSPSPVEGDSDSSPTKRARNRSIKRSTPFSGKERAKEREATYESPESSESESGARSTYIRGQTPGPSWKSEEREYDKSRSHKFRQ